MGPVKTRILTSAVLLPLVAVIYFGPRGLFLALAVCGGLVVTNEAVGLMRARGHRPIAAAALAAIVLLNFAFHAPERLPLAGALAACVALCVGAQVLLRTGLEEALDTLAATLGAILLSGFLLAFQVALRRLEGPAGFHPGALLVFLYAVVFGNDSAAYFAGRTFGRTRLAPAISPKKTVEGFLLGIVGGVLLGVLFAWWLPVGLTLPQAAGIGFLLAVTAVFGDLTISLLKRSADVKDTGSLLPGHGGLLDRLDGLLFTSPLLYLLATSPLVGLRG